MVTVTYNNERCGGGASHPSANLEVSMSVLASGTTKKLKIEGQTIKIKKLSYGEQKETMSQGADGSDMAMMDGAIVKSVIEWDIKDEKDNKMLISIESLDLLDAGFVNKLAQEILKFNNMDVDAEKNLEGPSKQA